MHQHGPFQEMKIYKCSKSFDLHKIGSGRNLQSKYAHFWGLLKLHLYGPENPCFSCAFAKIICYVGVFHALELIFRVWTRAFWPSVSTQQTVDTIFVWVPRCSAFHRIQ